MKPTNSNTAAHNLTHLALFILSSEVFENRYLSLTKDKTGKPIENTLPVVTTGLERLDAEALRKMGCRL